MRRTLLLAAALGLSGALCVPASARPVFCRLITDVAGDTTAVMPPGSAGVPVPGPVDGALDIVSADIASNPKVVTAVIRVSNLGTSAMTSPVGADYGLAFGVNEQRFAFDALRDATGYERFLLVLTGNAVGTGGVDIDGVFDAAHNEVRMTAPVEAFKELGGRVSQGAVSQELNAFTQRAFGAQGSYTFQLTDVAEAQKQYRFGSASCVTPGR